MDAVKVDIPIELPSIPAPIKDFIPYLSRNSDTPIHDAVKPYVAYEAELRKVYAQQPNHEAIQDGLTNMVPIFAGHEENLKIRARDPVSLAQEDVKSKYILPLRDEDRKANGTPATVTSLKEFRNNFNLFSESSLVDLDWSNVVAAGSAVTTSLLPLPKEASGNKRNVREYYHERLAPSSDVDLFIYGLNEEQAIEKMKVVEEAVKGAILYETTTIRTKNCITIASQYPVRHVQVVLRLYTSISEIITGFDVDCACAAYDGHQVYASPRAIVAFMTQCNVVDLTRRSPSYENRLSKYSHRGFEVLCPTLDRTRIDPTIFERSFTRTLGLARLLVLEKLPKSWQRENYMDRRRIERGRPAVDRSFRNRRRLHGNLKDEAEDDVADWISEEEISSYTTLTVPYGKRFNSTNITKLLYNQDLLLNAEWNKPKEREVNLHRHPCFFGSVKDIIEDCCGDCPTPVTKEETEIAEEESKRFISGRLTFISDDPGRQEIGSFRPLTDSDWTEMAYVGNTERLCQAIVNGEVDHVQDWCEQEGVDVNCRDYTGRTPLHLATQCSTVEVVQVLVDHGARLISRLVDGRTALHIAAARGDVGTIKVLMQKSLANEEEEDAKKEKEKAKEKEMRENEKKEKEEKGSSLAADKMDIDDEEMAEYEEMNSDEDSAKDSDDAMTMGSFVKITGKDLKETFGPAELPEENLEDPDIYDINVLAWDSGASPLHLAILCGQVDAIRLLVSEYGADVLLPIKLAGKFFRSNSAILTLVLAITLPAEKAREVAKVLLDLGATSAQATVKHFTALHFIVAQGNVETLRAVFEHDAPVAKSVLNHIAWTSSAITPLITATLNKNNKMVEELLKLGAQPEVEYDDWIKASLEHDIWAKNNTSEINMRNYYNLGQPLRIAIASDMLEVAKQLLERGADPALLDKHLSPPSPNYSGRTVLDSVQARLKEIRNYKEPEFTLSREPEKLQAESQYTRGLSGYQLWAASCDYHEKYLHLEAQRRTWHEDNKKREENSKVGVEEKAKALKEMETRLEVVEKLLIARGAKTYDELYPNPDYKLNEPIQHPSRQHESKPWEVKLRFRGPDLTPEKTNAYIRLFEACWDNNLEAVKEMTLGTWGATDPKQPPLRIVIQDDNGFNPYTIAIMRGHHQLASHILNIALAQYQPKDESGTHLRWNIDDEGSDCNGGEIGIHSELVDERFTVSDVGAVSNVVKSQLKPQLLIDHTAKLGRFDDDKDNFRFNSSLMDRAIQKNDTGLFDIVLQASIDQSKHFFETYEVTTDHFITATKKGRTTMLGEMIRLTGFGIPINNLAESSGAEPEKSVYYQGLTVGGRKRADWAAAAGSGRTGFRYENQTPPVLRAANIGNIESVEWFMSDTPLRKYKEWAEANKDDKRVRLLERAKGFDKAIRTFLLTRNEYIFHMAILSYKNQPKKTDLALLQHLLSVDPDSLDRRTIIQGMTPLHIAIKIERADIVSFLIAQGADQRSRDKENRNCIHHMLVPCNNSFSLQSRSDAAPLRQLIDLFDPSVVKELLLSRQKPGNQTPLTLWLHGNQHHLDSDIIEILESFSSGEDLDIIDDTGDLPLHIAIKKSHPTQVKSLIFFRPSTLFRENATGRTPLEMATDLYIQERVSTVPWEGNPPRNVYDNINNMLIKKPAAEFVPKERKVHRVFETQSVKRTWEVCAEAGQEASHEQRKRRLVSLFEASEVAKRLGGESFAIVPSAKRWEEDDKQEVMPVVQDEVNSALFGIVFNRRGLVRIS